MPDDIVDDIEAPKSYSANDLEWTSYVLSLMADNEKFKGAPKCIGLRRMVELLMGKIVESHARVVQSPVGTMDKEGGFTGNGGRCVVEHTIVIRDHVTGELIKYTGAADGTPVNVKEPFNHFMVPVTSTRAEARTLGNILKLQVVSYEEMNEDLQREINKNSYKPDAPPTQVPAYTKNVLTPDQKRVIINLANKVKVNVDKLIELSLKKQIKLEQVTEEGAKALIAYLNDCHQGKKVPPQEAMLIK